MKLSEIADRLGCKLVGDGGIEIGAVAGLEHARAGELTFLSNPRYAKLVESTRASAILLDREIEGTSMAMLVSGNPYLDFARALEFFYEAPKPKAGIHPSAAIAQTARIGKNATIGAYSVVGENVLIGDDAVIHPHVTIYEGVEIGDRLLAHANVVIREFCRIGNGVILQNGVIVGGDGYGFAHCADGSQYKIPQAGIVVIEDDVEIQANSCIDRAAVGETRIRRGTKIDNLVQIGHAVEVGENNIICSQSGVAGSTKLGNNCILAGQVGVINHLKIGNNVLMTAKTGVGVDIPDGQKISGAPSLDNRQWLRCVAVYNRLPELDKTVKALKRRVEELASAALPGDNSP